MTVRSTVVVGLLVLGSGAVAPAAQIVPRVPHTTLTTPPVSLAEGSGQVYSCRLLNVGKSALSVSSSTIKLLNGDDGLELPVSFTNTCSSLLQPGHTCFKSFELVFEGQGAPDATYCEISFTGNSDDVRGALQVLQRGTGPGLVVEAR